MDGSIASKQHYALMSLGLDDLKSAIIARQQVSCLHLRG